MTRVAVGRSLFGVGMFLLVAALGMALVIATFVQLKMVGQVPSIEPARADVKVHTTILPDVPATARLTGSIADRAVVWNVFQKTVRTDTGEAISTADSRIALDRVSGAAVGWNGQCLADEPFMPCATGNVGYAGQLYQFPFDTQKKSYTFYDSSMRKAVPIHYRGTDTIEGLRAYRFEQVITDERLNARAATLSTLTSRFAPGATSAEMIYNSRRTVWVEPVSGVIVSVHDVQRRTLVPATGPETVLFAGTFEFDAATLRSVTDDARGGRLQILALRQYVPIGLALLGLLGLGLGYWITRRAVR
jgi:hypothetical protein